MLSWGASRARKRLRNARLRPIACLAGLFLDTSDFGKQALVSIHDANPLLIDLRLGRDTVQSQRLQQNRIHRRAVHFRELVELRVQRWRNPKVMLTKFPICSSLRACSDGRL